MLLSQCSQYIIIIFFLLLSSFTVTSTEGLTATCAAAFELQYPNLNWNSRPMIAFPIFLRTLFQSVNALVFHCKVTVLLQSNDLYNAFSTDFEIKLHTLKHSPNYAGITLCNLICMLLIC